VRLFSTLLSISLRTPRWTTRLLGSIMHVAAIRCRAPRMRQLARMTIMSLAITAVALAKQTNDPSRVAAPDEATAVKIAESALTRIYGKKRIHSEKPFSANLVDGIWHVTGTLHCKDEHGKVIVGACVGGVSMAEVRQRDGRVLKTSHTKQPGWKYKNPVYTH